jgi:hypothetical protein
MTRQGGLDDQMVKLDNRLLISTAQAAAGCEGTWRELARMPSKRQELSTATLNGQILVIAGFDSNGMSTDMGGTLRCRGRHYVAEHHERSSVHTSTGIRAA